MGRWLAVVALLLAFGVPACAQSSPSYRDVQVGQQSGILRPEFDQVKWGEYDAQFGNERMQVFVNGALVTGFSVIPLVPMTVAEAVAKHGSIPDIPSMLLFLDPLGQAQGIVDPIRKIDYLTRSLDPDAIVSEVYYFDQNTGMLMWPAYAPPDFLQRLAEAANNVSLEAINARPQVNSLSGKAQFLVDQAVKEAEAQAKRTEDLLKHYAQSCGSGANCEIELGQLRQAASQLQAALNSAEHIYQVNVYSPNRPKELDQLETLSVEIDAKLRALAQRSHGVPPVQSR